MHTGRVREIKVRSMGDDGTQEVLVIYSDCVIARIDGAVVAELLQV
jgi:hypothetical protein